MFEEDDNHEPLGGLRTTKNVRKNSSRLEEGPLYDFRTKPESRRIGGESESRKCLPTSLMYRVYRLGGTNFWETKVQNCSRQK